MKDLKERLESDAYNPLWENWYLAKKDAFLGGGGFGKVYRYEMDFFGETRESAVKVIQKELIPELWNNKAEIDRIKRNVANDVLIMEKFKDDPNIITLRNYAIRDIIDDEDGIVGFDLLIQMDCLKPLNKYFKTEMGESDVEKLALQIGKALQTLHNCSVIHRDIKTGNILVDKKGDFILTDFGISKYNPYESTYDTMAGTPEFEAPEVAGSFGNVNYKKNADIYSLGLTLYYLLNNSMFPNQTSKTDVKNRTEAIAGRLKGASFPKPPRGSAGLKDVIMKCLEYYPEKRYQEMEEVLEDLYKSVDRDILRLLGFVDFSELDKYSDENKIEKIEYKNGAVYTGNVKEGKPHGTGKMVWSNGESFEGKWENGKRIEGRCLYKNGNIFEGIYGLANDGKTSIPLKGKMTRKYGPVEEGDFVPKGSNKFRLKNGTITYYDGSVFEGEIFENSRMNGKRTYKDGRVDEGEFRDNKRHGICKSTFPDGKVQDGLWISGNYSKNLSDFIHDESAFSEFFKYTMEEFPTDEQVKIIAKLSDEAGYSFSEWVVQNLDDKKSDELFRILSKDMDYINSFLNGYNYKEDEVYINMYNEVFNNMHNAINADEDDVLVGFVQTKWAVENCPGYLEASELITKNLKKALVEDYLFEEGKYIDVKRRQTFAYKSYTKGGKDIKSAIRDGEITGWGPERFTFSNNRCSDYPTFNSITDNVGVGDERNFVRAAEAISGEKYRDDIQIYPGKEYRIYIYFQNDAKPPLSTKEKGEVGVARGVKVWTHIPDSIAAKSMGRVYAVISGDNTVPAEVWDYTKMRNNSDTVVKLQYVPGSAKLYSGGSKEPKILPDLLFEGGTLIGLDKLDGVIPSDDNGSGYLVYSIKVSG